MKPLRPANTDTNGRVGYCLAFATKVFDVPNKYESAWKAWQGSQFKHTDSLPNVPVPVWFSWWGTVEGVYANWGHVAVHFPGLGLLSSPFQAAVGQHWFKNIDDLLATLRKYASGGAASYVGWSEDINGVRIAMKETEEMTKQDAIALLDSYFWTHVGRKVKDSELDEYVPLFMAGEPDKFFKKAADFDEVRKTLGNITPDAVIKYVQANLK